MRDFDPAIEQAQFVFISREVAAKALRLTAGCQNCRGEDAQIPFDCILDRVTGSDPAVTDYVLEAPLTCRYCGAEIHEKTLVERDIPGE
jgi:hypothetical protein